MKKKHALVTGASRGIGATIALQLAQEGFSVTLVGRDASALKSVANNMPNSDRCYVACGDITDPASMKNVIAQATNKLGPLHVLVNNAGQATSSSIDKTELDAWEQMLSVNLTGTYICIREALASLRETASAEDPSRIINVASTAGLQGYPHVSAYVAAKHGVIGLTRSLALELAKQHICVNAVCPGYTETDIAIQAVENLMQKTGKTAEQARSILTARNPQSKMIKPEEVANAVVWLSQRGSASVNGQAIAIDGGELAG